MDCSTLFKLALYFFYLLLSIKQTNGDVGANNTRLAFGTSGVAAVINKANKDGLAKVK